MMKGLLTAAALLVGALLPARAQAAAIVCDQATTGLRLCIPRYGTSFDNWARADIAAFQLLNSSVSFNSTATVATHDWLQVRRFSGVSTAPANGIQLSSAVYQDAGFYFTTRSSMSVLGGGGVVVTYGISAATGAFGTTVVPSSAALMVAGNASVSGRIEVSSLTLSGSDHSGLEWEPTAVNLQSEAGFNILLDGDNDDNEVLFIGKNARTVGGSTQLLSLDQSGNLETLANVDAGNDLLASDDVDVGDDVRAGDQGIFGGTLTVKGAMGLTASSGAFTATGAANPFAVTSSTGIYVATGKVKLGPGAWVEFDDGTTQKTAASAGTVAASTVGYIAAGAASQITTTDMRVCIDGSTMTMTTGGNSRVLLNIAGAYAAGAGYWLGKWLVDGAPLPGFTGGSDYHCGGWDNGSNQAGIFCPTITEVLSAGSHSFCFVMATPSGGTGPNKRAQVSAAEIR
jgi:hypothetical protein